MMSIYESFIVESEEITIRRELGGR